jgi:hypothetical protein
MRVKLRVEISPPKTAGKLKSKLKDTNDANEDSNNANYANKIR